MQITFSKPFICLYNAEMAKKVYYFLHETLSLKGSSPEPFLLGKYPNIWKGGPLMTFKGTFASGPLKCILHWLKSKGLKCHVDPWQFRIGFKYPEKGHWETSRIQSYFLSFVFFSLFSASLLSLVLLPQSQILRLGLSLDHGDWQNPQISIPFSKAAPISYWFSSAELIH